MRDVDRLATGPLTSPGALRKSVASPPRPALPRGEVDYQALIAGRRRAVVSNPDGQFQLFRFGEAVASRNIHAAVYDTLRLCKDL